METYNFISKYLLSSVETRTGRRDACIGASATIIVVFFVSFLVSAIYDSNFLFLKLAENQASEADFIFLPRPTNRSTSPFLNFTAFTEALRNSSDPLLEEDGGTSARWLAVAELTNTQDVTAISLDMKKINKPRKQPRTTTTTIIVVDTEREVQVKMGRLFNQQYRKLGKQEAYFSNTICAALGVPPKKGQRITMKIDLLELAGTLLGSERLELPDGSTVSLSDAIKDPVLLKLFLAKELGVDFDENIVVPTATITNDVLIQASLAARTGDTNAQLLAGLLVAASPIIPTTVSFRLGQLFDAIYPTLIQTLIIEEEFIVADEIATPNGKYPNGIGNVMLIEREDAERLLRRTFVQLKELIDPIVTPLRPNASSLNASELAANNANPLVVAYEGLVSATSIDLRHFAMQLSVQVKDRRTMYASDQDTMQAMVTNISDRLAEVRPKNVTVSILTPVAAAVGAFQFIRLFLDNIFNSMIFLLTLLGSLVIYSLMLGNVETKTYEYGMLRALGMPYGTLKSLLYSQAGIFAIMGIVFGTSIAGLVHLPLAGYFAVFSGLDIDYRLPDHAIVFGVTIGLVMPLLANYAPVRRALSSTLRDALDIYRKSANEISVQLQKLEDMGLSPGVSAFAAMLFIIGITTFYFLPLSFVFGQIGLFLGILNGILLGILLGLSLLSQMIQPLIEQVILQIMFLTCCTKKDQCLQPIVRKNLFGHRSRNRKLSYVLTIAVAFLIFAGSLFALQGRVIEVSVSQILGADISMSSFRTGVEKDANGRPRLVGLPEETLNSVLNQTGNGVASWTYVTYNLRDFPFVLDARIGSSTLEPNRRSNVYGLQSNFLDVAYEDYVVVTSRNGAGRVGEQNIVREMIEERGKIVLPGEETDDNNRAVKGGASVTKNIVASKRGSFATCATSVEKEYVFLKCENKENVITKVRFARYGTPLGVCTEELLLSSSSSSVSDLSVSDRCDAGDYVYQYFTAKCIGRSSCGAAASNQLFGDPCPGTAKWMTVHVECGSREEVPSDVVTIEPPPLDYVDALVSQALTDYCSINSAVPFGLRLRTGYNLPGSIHNDMNLKGKARAYLSKAPGFLFSSYQILAWQAPLLIPLETYTNLAFRAYDLAQNFQLDEDIEDGTLTNEEDTTSTATLNNNNITFVNKTQERLDLLKQVGINPFLNPIDIPKQRLLVKMTTNSTLLEKSILINALMASSGSGIGSQFSSLVTDTKDLIASTEVATVALNLFLVFISVIIMIIATMTGIVSFAANVNEHSVEFAVLRSIGVSAKQNLRIWISEALALVLSSFTCGSIIGVLVASSLTLTQNLFLEQPFQLALPWALLFSLFFLSIGVAVGSSYFPAQALNLRPIAGVLKG